MSDSSELDRVLSILRARADELRRRGVRHASVFGSVARGEDGADSDIDVLITLDPAVHIDAFGFAGVIGDLEDWIGRKVDVARRDMLRDHVRTDAVEGEVRAF